jgi:hypothetical protein
MNIQLRKRLNCWWRGRHSFHFVSWAESPWRSASYYQCSRCPAVRVRSFPNSTERELIGVRESAIEATSTAAPAEPATRPSRRQRSRLNRSDPRLFSYSDRRVRP